MNTQELMMELAPCQRRLVLAAIEDLERAYAKIQDALGEHDQCMLTCMDIQDVITSINTDILELKDAFC